jgi:hypothetical protein
MKVVVLITLAAVILSLVVCGSVVAGPKRRGDPDIIGTIRPRSGPSFERVRGGDDTSLIFGFTVEVWRGLEQRAEASIGHRIVKRLPRIAGPTQVRK